MMRHDLKYRAKKVATAESDEIISFTSMMIIYLEGRFQKREG
jgi:hypothetical protein